jgi:hypothetical protein
LHVFGVRCLTGWVTRGALRWWTDGSVDCRVARCTRCLGQAVWDKTTEVVGNQSWMTHRKSAVVRIANPNGGFMLDPIDPNA